GSGAARNTHPGLGGPEGHGIATVATELVDLEAAELRVDEPVVADPDARVVGELLQAVAPDVAWAGRRDLHDDMGRDADESVRWGGEGGRKEHGEVRLPAAPGAHRELRLGAGHQPAPTACPAVQEGAQPDHDRLVQ